LKKSEVYSKSVQFGSKTVQKQCS